MPRRMLEVSGGLSDADRNVRVTRFRVTLSNPPAGRRSQVISQLGLAAAGCAALARGGCQRNHSPTPTERAVRLSVSVKAGFAGVLVWGASPGRLVAAGFAGPARSGRLRRASS